MPRETPRTYSTIPALSSPLLPIVEMAELWARLVPSPALGPLHRVLEGLGNSGLALVSRLPVEAPQALAFGAHFLVGEASVDRRLGRRRGPSRGAHDHGCPDAVAQALER